MCRGANKSLSPRYRQTNKKILIFIVRLFMGSLASDDDTSACQSHISSSQPLTGAPMNLPYNYLDLTIEMDPIFDD